MTKASSGSLRLGALALLALVVLHIVWHTWWLPPPAAQRWLALVVAVVPLLPGLWVCLRDLRRGVLIGGIVCLFYFCHGVALAWSDATARGPALIEVGLTVIVIGALGWDARHYRRKPR